MSSTAGISCARSRMTHPSPVGAVSEDSVFVFGSFRFLPRRQLLLRGGQPIKLGCRAMDILHLLLQNAGEPVSKRALQRFVWSDIFVDESNLKVHVHSLRRALGDTAPHPTYIATVTRRGYRFIQPVSIEPVDPAQFSSGTVPPRVRRSFPDGIYFVNLSATNDLSIVPDMLAAACGIQGSPDDTVAAVAEYLANRRVLIVMDSCEHVLPSVAVIARRFQEAGVAAGLLATSLEPLRLALFIHRDRGDTCVGISGLST